MYGEGLGTVTDFDGNYYLSLAVGKQTIKASYVGYKAIEIDVEITSNNLNLLKFRNMYIFRKIIDFKTKT